ncbi:SUMF1/EgtB/PvdO family nonheme iron enzyme [Marinobacterium sediminicola]|uniref:Formylglycine-generating enzyme, required for sulfatase activity, contains SUMF1/FGE domain n=1 Tax=Marinobacterium sediminicola TaxID=518898 RepID=A0ABY1RWQ2_9GAMM|nr:SUMF1/EgtB/PvdO family nonheme iron enzyme [Marinobacterium sediminicola]ULG70263.1 SUMF1/EgtB/PvdO family nonheme iron enzyme [Marinobacterium sediminicola]SMR69914.1 Formylglycine-generating enzyme, required for sulfatase activity, contains SUMF1/FGE domain [Marinobacterium sediminicola]
MNTPTDAIFAALKEELVIGPNHHRFQLVRHQRDHYLGTIWLAEDISTTSRIEVSLLILRPELARQPSLTDKLRKRITQLRPAMDHPHIATCYGYFSWRGLEFLSFEQLSGQTLSDLMARKQASKLKPLQKQGLLTQLAKALDYSQIKTHLSHGLLAPDLVFLNPGGGVKLIGQGLRDLVEPIHSLLPHAPEYTRYQPPEAFHPQPAHAGHDVYALALIAWEVYSGKQAFQADDPESSRFQRELKAPAELSKQQSQALSRGLNPDPEQRYSNCSELIRALFVQEEESSHENDTDKPDQNTATLDVAANDPDSPQPSSLPADQDTPAADAAPLAPKSRSASFARRLLSKPFKRMLLAVLIFGGGFAAGVWSTLLLTQGQLDSISAQALNQMKSNRELRAAFESLEQAHEQLQKEHEAVKASTSRSEPSSSKDKIESAKELREAQHPAANLTLFQDELNDGSRGPEMVIIPAGRFRMGDLHGQGDDNEYPVHEVVIGHSFALARHEITFAEYDRFAQATGRPMPDDEGWGRGQRPVVNVTWLDAEAYTQWLSEQTGQPYRLPTEAEWEYSARASTESVYWWGDKVMDGYAVCDGCGSDWDGKSTAPVGSTKANPWGVFDLSGNVDEWVQDCYQPNYNNAPGDGRAEQSSRCHQRVMRGGSWFDIPRLVRPSSRYRHPADTSRNSWGFRVALDLPASMQ